MRLNVLITLAVLTAIVVALYTAHSMDLVGMIMRGHGGMGHGDGA